MAMTPEKKVKNAVVAILKEYGAYYFYPVTGGYGSSGVPDIVACHLGKFIGIECKAGKGVDMAARVCLTLWPAISASSSASSARLVKVRRQSCRKRTLNRSKRQVVSLWSSTKRISKRFAMFSFQ